jgi:hypothetical protein
MLIDLTHSSELAWLVVRVVTLAVVVWDLVDASRDLRGAWHSGRLSVLMLAKWRVAHDVFLCVLAVTWIASLGWVMASSTRHGETTHLLLAFQNGVVAFLLVQTCYLRLIRTRIAAGSVLRKGDA